MSWKPYQKRNIKTRKRGIGATDDIGWHITQDPIHVNDYHATILKLFGFDHLRLTYT